MARIKAIPRSDSAHPKDDLVAAIVKALEDEEQPDSPVVFEIATGSTDYVQTVVVWDRWSELPSDIRTAIVMEAYRKANAEDPEIVEADRISSVLPVTIDQALELGVLPYSVQCTVNRRDARYAEIQALLKREGALEIQDRTELRMPTREMAIAARQRLEAATQGWEPEVLWQIGEQVGRIIDY